jgi:uncharacterized membrane protein
MNRRTFPMRPAFWVTPAVYIVLALIAGITLPRVEGRISSNFSLLSTSTAIAIYSSVASGMMALTGIVFSLTFLVVQFSASSYSPRLIGVISRDAVTGHALGVFTATFLYATSAVGGVDRGGSGKVPFLSVLILLLLLLLSVIFFIALINRIGTLQINRILDFIGGHGRRAISVLYQEREDGTSRNMPPDQALSSPTQTIVHSGKPRVVQSFDVDALVRLARENAATIKLDAAVGDPVVESTPLILVFCKHSLNEQALRRAIQLGDERTIEQDPKYAIRLLVDIAIRALSPAVNDPTTAVQALDQIEDLLLRLGSRRLDIGAYRDENGELRVVFPVPTWEDFLLLALDEIRSYGATSIQVMRRMKALVTSLISVLPEQRRGALNYWEAKIENTIAGSFPNEEEKADASLEDRQGLGVPRQRINRSVSG